MILEDRRDVDREIQETLGVVPEFFKRIPDYLLPTEWASFKNLQLSDQTATPNKYKQLIGLAASGATRYRYCAYFHAEAARLFGQRDGAHRQEHDGLEHLPQHPAVRLRRVRARVRPDRRTRARADGRRRAGLTIVRPHG